jgi:flavorubredoxin
MFDLGGKEVRYLATPHVPHCWDAGLLFEETTKTLFCGDLFTQIGKSSAVSTADILAPALAAEDTFLATALTPQTAPTIRRLATLKPAMLALMHGPAFRGDCERALLSLADAYEERCKRTL